MSLFLRLGWLLSLVYFLYLHNLDGVGLLGPDEPRYAWIGREMARSGDWVTPRLWGEAWFEKPPLLYWLTAAGFLAGLGNDLAPRLPVALLSVCFLAAYYFLLREQLGNDAALYATAMLGTSAGWLAYSHLGLTDLPLSATFALAMLFCMRWITDGETSRLPLAGVCLGLALLAKGLVPLVLSIPLVWFARQRLKDLWKLALPAVAVAAPWYGVCYARNGPVFWEELILRHHLGRFVSADLQHVQPFWFYVPVLAGGLFPWSFLLAWLRRPQNLIERFFGLWAGFGFLFFSLSVNKLPGYLLPLLPAIFALAGANLARSRHLAAFLALTAAMLALLPTLASILPQAVDDGLSRTNPDFRPLLLAPLFGGLILLAVRWSHARRAFGVVITLLAGGLLYLQAQSYPALNEQGSARQAWRKLAGQPQSQCLENPRRAFRYQMNYYAERALPDCETRSTSPPPGGLR